MPSAAAAATATAASTRTTAAERELKRALAHLRKAKAAVIAEAVPPSGGLLNAESLRERARLLREAATLADQMAAGLGVSRG